MKFQQNKGVIIGSWLARYLGVDIGNFVNITTTNLRSSILGTFPRTLSLEVVGIFEIKGRIRSIIGINSS